MARRERREDPPVETELPITPMLDMTFQLMAFFIMAFKPMPTEGQLSLMLPKEDASKTQTVDQSVPTDESEDYRLIISSDRGDIAKIGLKIGNTAAVETVEGADLLKKLDSIAKTPGRKITLEAAPDLKYGRLINLMDTCKKAGFDSVGIAEMKKNSGAAAAPEPKK